MTDVSTVTLDANTIILAVINLAGLCVTGFLALRQSTIAAEQREQKTAQIEATKSLGDIHTAVNSGKTAMEDQIKTLNKIVLELSGTIKTLEERLRGTELAKGIADARRVTDQAPAPMPVTSATGHPSKLKDAIADLTEAAKDTVVAADKTVGLVVKVPQK